MVYLAAHLLAVGLTRPKATEDLGAGVTELELREEHALACEFNVHVELENGLHECARDDR